MAKRTITITSQVEVDVEFPYYTKVSDYTYCLIKSENGGFCVQNYSTNNFSINYGSIPDNWYNAEQISKEEFDKVFNEVQEKINQLI